jgi:hypothetical protein
VIHRIVHTWQQTKDGQLPLAGRESSAKAASSPKPQISIPASVQSGNSTALLTRAAKRGN